MTETLLVLSSPFGLPPFSSRNATQTLTPIDQAKQIKRSVLGTAVNVALPQFKKYSSQITCSDLHSFILDGNWPGETVTVDCIVELSYLTEGGSPQRPVVSGSSRVQGDYTFYRPKITFLVTDFNITEDEYGAVTSWTMDLQEV